MASEVLTVILSDVREVLKMYIDEFGGFNVVESNRDTLLSTLSSAEKSVLFVDLEEENVLDLVLSVTKNISQCSVVVMSEEPSVDLMVKAMRAGAKDFLPLPILKSELFTILDKICSPKQHKSRCKIISVFSNKGGIGKTSIASNLALELAQITKENTALIDLNFQMGDITTFMDLKPSFNISYMLENLDKVNDDFLLSTLERYKGSNLYVLADPPYFKQAANISSTQICKLLNILKNTFSYIVIDAEAGFGSKNMAALTESDLILLVTVANLPALRNTQRCLELFERLGFDKEKTQILLNRYMENDEVSIKDVEEVLRRKIYGKVPNNYFAMMSAINKGVPVCETNPDCNVAKSYKDLAMYIINNIYKENLVNRFENLIRRP